MTCNTKIAIGQLCSSSNLEKNLQTVVRLISQAIDRDARVIFFPEATDFIARNQEHSRWLARETPSFVSKLKSCVRSLTLEKHKPIDVSIGVHLPSRDPNIDPRTRNVALYIDSNGKILQEYSKLHLFDISIRNGPILNESSSVQPGTEVSGVLETPIGKLGTAICYDIRFPELGLKLRDLGAEVITYPSAFTMSTGEAHWELLGKARALDTQCFVIMPGQQGEHNVYDDDWEDPKGSSKRERKRQSWGHSMVVDPWGQVIAKAEVNDGTPQLIVANLDLEFLKRVRTQMPLWDHRRNDIFGKI